MVIADFQVNGSAPSTVGGSSTSVQYFPRLLGLGFNTISTAPSSSSAVGQLAVPGDNRLNGQQFSVLASGNVVSGSGAPSETVEIALYAQTSAILSSPSYTKIATTGAVQLNPTLDGVVNPWFIEADLQGDTASGIVQGIQYAMYSGTLENSTPKALTANLSGISFGAAATAVNAAPTTNVPFGLVVGVTFNQSNSGNKATLYQFQIALQ